jgi:hypothetical protein
MGDIVFFNAFRVRKYNHNLEASSTWKSSFTVLLRPSDPTFAPKRSILFAESVALLEWANRFYPSLVDQSALLGRCFSQSSILL